MNMPDIGESYALYADALTKLFKTPVERSQLEGIIEEGDHPIIPGIIDAKTSIVRYGPLRRNIVTLTINVGGAQYEITNQENRLYPNLAVLEVLCNFFTRMKLPDPLWRADMSLPIIDISATRVE